jgi:sugar lactone lactonase YvrE
MTKLYTFLTLPRHLGFWLWLISLPMPVTAITWTNQQPADLVLGQTNFTTATSGLTQNTLTNPVSVAIDPTTNKVFVSDSGNHRVLRFSSVTSLTNGAAAEVVLGQADFTSNPIATTATGMHLLGGICVDSAGRLWVSDYGNNRVLRFDNASTIATGAPANGVLGQSSFTTFGNGATQSSLSWPKDVVIDSAGRLWVADYTNNRVLRFDNAASKANGANADGVLGQPDFTSSSVNLTQNGMSGPEGITIDSAGNLFVADLNNRRVLRFDNATAKANGANADAVLGQPNFTSNTVLVSATGMKPAYSVAIDNLGQLYVSDTEHSRILIYQNAATLGNGAAASYVLGQPDFTSATANNGGVSASSLLSPHHLFFDNVRDSLWVADINNHRVFRYAIPEIQLLDGATDLPLNSMVNLGATNVGTPIIKILTIKTLGNGNLNLTGSPMVSVTGTGFSVTANPPASIASANPSIVTLQFNPGAVGPATGTVSIVNNDSDENPFTLNLQATGVGTVGSPVVVDRLDSDDTGSFAACTTAANDCSLRGAVAAVTSGGIINFDASIAGQTITLSNTIVINKSLTIDGTGQKISISGNNVVRVFMVITGVPTFRALTIKNGNTGAGNQGGGLFINGGSNTSSVIDQCTFVGNQADWGGAISSNNSAAWTVGVTITNSTFTTNQATNGGGGAIRLVNAKAILVNNTIVNNQASMAWRGGGISIYYPSYVQLKNTILAANTSNGVPDDCECETYSLGLNIANSVLNNLVQVGNCTGITAAPQLGALQDNGGDTQTMALLTGSPAIDAGDNASCQATDQRGISRPLDGNDDGTVPCDIGAIEFLGIPKAPSNLTATAMAMARIDLAWQDNSSVETGFKMERNGTLIQTTGANVVTFTDVGLICGTTYNYTVKATNTVGDSTGTTASATTFACPPPAPPLPPMTLTLSFSGTGTGRITSDLGGIDCSPTSSTCSYTVTTPTWVTLTTVPGDGSELSSWTGDTACQTDGQVLILADTACVATFDLKFYELTVGRLGQGYVKGPGLDCPSTCTATFLYGTEIQLTAVADREWYHTGWQGSCDPKTGKVKLTNALSCEAVFKEDPAVPNQLDGNGDGIPDAHQPNVISLSDKVGGNYLTFEVTPSTCVIGDIYSDLPEKQKVPLDPTKKFPQGLLYFDIVCPQAQVSIYHHGLSKVYRNLKFYKFGPKIPGDMNTLAWYQLPNVKYEVATVGGKPVLKATYTLKDGELGDSTGVDGHIVDPGGIELQ